MIECYGGSHHQVDRSTNEDAFVIGRDPVPYAAVCDGAGNALQAAHRVIRFFERMIKDPQAQVADPEAWMNWVRLMDSQLLGGTQSTFVGVAVSDEKSCLVVGAYAGNSRVYVVGENGVRLVTTESSPARLGSGKVKPCPIMLALDPYDILLLMSDGAWNPLGRMYKLQKTAARAAMRHFSEVPQAILDAAARIGRYDDMTAVALRIR